MANRETIKEDKGRVLIKVKNPKRKGSIILSEYHHPETGDLIHLEDKNGDERIFSIERGTVHLDLNNENDRKMYEFVKNHPVYVKGPDPILEVINVKEEAEKGIDKERTIHKAKSIVFELQGNKLANFARVLGKNVDNVDESVVKQYVINHAKENPEDVIEEWENPDRSIKELLLKGKERGVFRTDGGVWKYGQHTMGTDLVECIEWYKDNEDLQPSIRKKVNKIR